MNYDDMSAKLDEENMARRACWGDEIVLIRRADKLVLCYGNGDEAPFEPDVGFGSEPGDKFADDWFVWARPWAHLFGERGRTVCNKPLSALTGAVTHRVSTSRDTVRPQDRKCAVCFGEQGSGAT